MTADAPRWSILVASLLDRHPQTIFGQLQRQLRGRTDIELLALVDNRLRTVGAKRNTLLQMARGEYISFIDDDDAIADDYVDTISLHLGSADVITFRQDAILIRESILHRCRYSLRTKERTLAAVNDPTTGDPAMEDGRLVMAYEGPPAHTHVWRAAYARGVLFPLRNWQEDIAWCDIVARRCQTETTIDKTLYYYRMDSANSATRGPGAAR